MGLTEQCEIRVCQSGEPCIVQVHATRLGLSAALARSILVSPIARPA
jgi:Fe2+ transport system protein FeoA